MSSTPMTSDAMTSPDAHPADVPDVMPKISRTSAASMRCQRSRSRGADKSTNS
jgi:hypothetical protein